MNRLLGALFLSVGILQGCAARGDANEVFLADGSRGYHVRCGGFLGTNFGECLAAAGRVCGASGYTVVTRESDSAFIQCKAASR